MAELDSGDAADVLSAIDIAIEKSLHFTPDQLRVKSLLALAQMGLQSCVAPRVE